MNNGELRKDFEISILFRADLHGGKQGFLEKRLNGTYKDARTELLFKGYEMARNSDAGHVKRFAKDRYLGPGHMLQINETMKNRGQCSVTETQVRTILEIIGGNPV